MDRVKTNIKERFANGQHASPLNERNTRENLLDPCHDRVATTSEVTPRCDHEVNLEESRYMHTRIHRPSLFVSFSCVLVHVEWRLYIA